LLASRPAPNLEDQDIPLHVAWVNLPVATLPPA
jgi:hypothetical protein